LKLLAIFAVCEVCIIHSDNISRMLQVVIIFENTRDEQFYLCNVQIDSPPARKLYIVKLPKSVADSPHATGGHASPEENIRQMHVSIPP